MLINPLEVDAGITWEVKEAAIRNGVVLTFRIVEI